MIWMSGVATRRTLHVCYKTPISPAERPGMHYFMRTLRGAYWLAHTWASRPTVQVLFVGLPMQLPPFKT